MFAHIVSDCRGKAAVAGKSAIRIRLYLRMHGHDLQAALLRHGEQSAARTREFGDAADEAPGELGQAQAAINFAGQFDQRLGALPVLLGKMQIAGNFQCHGGLIGKSTGAANVLLRNSRAVQTIKDAKHAQHLSSRPQQRHGQKLMHVIPVKDVDVGSGRAAGLIRPENLFGAQRLGRHAFGKRS